MEFNASIVGLIVLLLIFVPIVFLMLNASGPNNKVKKAASKLSETNGIKLKNFEVIGNCVIGVNTVSKKLFILQNQILPQILILLIWKN